MKMNKGLLWVCIIIGGIALLVLLSSIIATVITISIWLIRIAGVILGVCLVVVLINAVIQKIKRG